MPSNRFDWGLLAQRLNDARTSVGFDAFKYEEVAAILLSAHEFDAEIPPAERPSVIWQAAASVAHGTPYSAQNLRTAIARAERGMLARPSFKAKVVAGVSLHVTPGLSQKRVLGNKIKLFAAMPTRIRIARENPDMRIKPDDVTPIGYSTAVVDVDARSAHEAVAVGMRTLDFVRGIWNYAVNRRTIIRFDSGQRDPINVVRLARAHTLHNPDGSARWTGFWQEANSVPWEATRAPSQWETLRRFQFKVLSRLRGHPYESQVIDGFVRYARALDGADFESAFLKLWGLVEFLTRSGGSNYDVAIRRILFLFSDRDLTRQVLQHLRTQRNSTIHDGDASASHYALTWQVKRYAEQLLLFHLTVGRSLSTIDEAARLLDLPSDKAQLVRFEWLARRARKFIS